MQQATPPRARRTCTYRDSYRGISRLHAAAAARGWSLAWSEFRNAKRATRSSLQGAD